MHRSRIIAYLQKTRKSSSPALLCAQPLSDRILAAKTVFFISIPPRHYIWCSSSKYGTRIYAGLTAEHKMIYIIPQGPIMRYPAQHKQQTRQRIVRSALRRFRSRGTQGASIGTLMRALRLTTGGLYPPFPSNNDLFVAAFEQGL